MPSPDVYNQSSYCHILNMNGKPSVLALDSCLTSHFKIQRLKIIVYYDLSWFFRLSGSNEVLIRSLSCSYSQVVVGVVIVRWQWGLESSESSPLGWMSKMAFILTCLVLCFSLALLSPSGLSWHGSLNAIMVIIEGSFLREESRKCWASKWYTQNCHRLSYSFGQNNQGFSDSRRWT